jgi:hypothetical protein
MMLRTVLLTVAVLNVLVGAGVCCVAVGHHGRGGFVTSVVMADRHRTNSRPNSITVSTSLFLKGCNAYDNLRVFVINLISKEGCFSHVIKFIECYNERALVSQITQSSSLDKEG